ncbi:MAG: glutamate formimidoyltransferase [Candidatus Saganbacteria bacterium]|nr:glutamate formimidoyltransferase [Candidatus Saganbacteria bacterium]
MLECVPNFSEGRDSDLIDQIILSVKACPILDFHSDPDHNRTVVTFAGDDEKVIQAAYELSTAALELIDINKHAGAHPFLGSVDVVPFIPLKNTPMKNAVTAANTLGEMLWKEHALPAYLYGHAAKISERVDLPYVRKGGLKVLKNEFSSKHRQPDIGDKLHPYAGAIAIGARDFLIAFNVNLKTPDIDIARLIAKNIRGEGVRALGLYLESRKITQVSINLTDHKKTSLKDVFGSVKKWAKEEKVEILESELVGMLPKEAVFDGMKEYLQLNSFSSKKILK